MNHQFKEKCCIVLLFILLVVNAKAGVIFELEFTKADGDVIEWFDERGWEFRADMDDVSLSFEDNLLIIETKTMASGMISKTFTEKPLKNITHVRIEWGVDQYPKGADWNGAIDKHRNTRNPIAFIVYFGKKRIDSGAFYFPDLLYFIGLFLGENEKPNQVYLGNNWQKGERYFCEPCSGKTGDFTTIFNVS